MKINKHMINWEKYDLLLSITNKRVWVDIHRWMDIRNVNCITNNFWSL